MDWGIDPERVAEITEIVRNRRFSAADTEKFILAVVGGAGDHADSMLWEMSQVLLGLGGLLASPRLQPRDAAIAAFLDESGLLLAPLRRGKHGATGLCDVSADAAGLTLGTGSASRVFSWSRVKRAMGLADFLFLSPQVDPAVGTGTDALRQALDVLFSADDDLISASKRAVQAPARYMRSWRKRFLPLQAFADLIRHREAFLAQAGRTGRGRNLDADDLLALWAFAIENRETWSYGRFVEKAAALFREERTDTDRRAFLAPVSIDTMTSGEPQDDPESIIIAWLDRDEEALPDADAGDGDDLSEPAQEEDGGPVFAERSLSALNALPQTPKIFTKEERREIAQVLSLIPIAHEQPVTLLRTMAVTPWENRLIEASRRGLQDDKGGAFDYAASMARLTLLDRQVSELILMAVYLERRQLIPTLAQAEGAKVLKKWQHDRSSFRMEDAELAQTFTRMGHDLRIVAGSLKRILQQTGRLAGDADLDALGMRDEASFAAAFEKRYANVKGKQP